MSIKSYKFENVVQKSNGIDETGSVYFLRFLLLRFTTIVSWKVFEKPFESRRPREVLFLHRFFSNLHCKHYTFVVRNPEKSRNHIIVWTSSDFKVERVSKNESNQKQEHHGENKNLLTDAQRVVPRRETFTGFLDGNTYVEF